MTQRILILCAKTWGQLGNYVAAKKLGEALAESFPSGEIVIQPFEDYCPFFAEAGQKIRTIYSSGETPAERQGAYVRHIEETGRLFDGFEENARAAVEGVALDLISQRILETRCKLVVGLKGLISRIAATALRTAGTNVPPVVNYVTNDGLLSFDAHRPRDAMLNLVQTRHGAQALADAETTPPGAHVLEVGVLIRNRAPENAPAPTPDRATPVVGMLVNRGGREYEIILQGLRDLGRSVRAEIIFVESDRLAAMARDMAREFSLDWSIDETLPHDRYQERLAALSAGGDSIMICKTAPNTTFEALSHGLPVIGLQSGLPMEDWVGRLVAQRGLGVSTPDAEVATQFLGDWVANSQSATALRSHVARFSEEFFEYEKTQDAIADQLRNVLQDSGPTAPPPARHSTQIN